MLFKAQLDMVMKDIRFGFSRTRTHPGLSLEKHEVGFLPVLANGPPALRMVVLGSARWFV